LQNSFASPLSIRSLCSFTDKQFVWTATRALSRQQRWPEIERLMTSKKILGGVKFACPFAWTHLFAMLAENGTASKEVSDIHENSGGIETGEGDYCKSMGPS
jgi:hypothetical protein